MEKKIRIEGIKVRDKINYMIKKSIEAILFIKLHKKKCMEK